MNDEGRPEHSSELVVWVMVKELVIGILVIQYFVIHSTACIENGCWSVDSIVVHLLLLHWWNFGRMHCRTLTLHIEMSFLDLKIILPLNPFYSGVYQH